ncbi:MAG: EAL domain-containing protein, partial [Gammaproteobacteria bacterium]|nr:EAL domain-containing protein [Gammaproteobacteria bacterium]
LYNRYAIERNIAEHLKLEIAGPHVLMLIDLDQFKLINDAVGHVAGDELLRQISQICKQVLPANTMIGRVGGDDFYMLFPTTSEVKAVEYARSLLSDLQAYRFLWESGEFNVSASIGLVSFNAHEYTMAALVTAVDTAFYAAKTKGRNQLHIYRHDDNRVQQYNDDIQISSVISEALQGGAAQFELYAQDIVPLQYSTSALSYEILLRMRDSKGEMCMPGQFLPTAERYQLMTEIDTYVLWKYLETVCDKHNHIEKLAFVNINLAGATLNHPDFQQRLKAAIEKFDFPWSKLVLEVTETSAVGNLLMASDFIKYCRDIGIRVALDDFGTGMASFEYLKHLPFDVVKIDGNFVKDMLLDPVDHAMVSYVHQISKLRKQETIAEFIEDEEHLQALKEIGVDYGQGYHLGKPRPLIEWL